MLSPVIEKAPVIAKASKVGGVVAGALGWLVMLFGLSFALGLGLLFRVIWSLGVGLAFALPLALLTLGMGIPLLMGGKALRRSATETERDMRDRALLSMLSDRGRVSAVQAAGVLGVRVDEADAHLTALAKQQPDRVAVDVDEEGTVWFRAAAMPFPQAGAWAPARVRVQERPAAQEEAEAEAAEEVSTGRAGGKSAS
jgi:hypothetical protein